MNKTTLSSLLSAAAALISSCSTPPMTANAAGIDKIVVLYSASGDLEANDLQRVEIGDAATIDRWVASLDEIPELPTRGIRYITFRGVPSQHRIEFYRGDDLARVARLRGGQLDVAAHEGWAFYSGEDRSFQALVAAVLPNAGATSPSGNGSSR